MTDPLRDLVSELLDRIESGVPQSIGSIGNVRMVQFGIDEIARYRERAALAVSGPRQQELDNHHNALMCPYCNPAGVSGLHPAQECDTCRRLQAKIELNERDHLRTINERDNAQEWADKLAYAVGGIEAIGEHSSVNNPWANALELLENRGALAAGPRREPNRLVELARQRAIGTHIAYRSRDARYPTAGHDGDFNVCPNDDCRLVWESLAVEAIVLGPRPAQEASNVEGSLRGTPSVWPRPHEDAAGLREAVNALAKESAAISIPESVPEAFKERLWMLVSNIQAVSALPAGPREAAQPQKEVPVWLVTCPDCDSGVAGGKPCETCSKSGYVRVTFAAGAQTERQHLEAIQANHVFSFFLLTTRPTSPNTNS